MPLTITPVSEFSGSFVGPSDGDSCDSASVIATDTGFQETANRLQYLKDRVAEVQPRLWIDGAMAGRLEVFCFGGGSNAITVGAIDEIALPSTGPGGIAVFQTSDILTPYDPGTYAASTEYHLYIRNNAGTLELSHDTAVPNTGSKRWKTGDANYRYLATFFTDSAANLRPFYKIGGRYHYLRAAGPGTLVVLNSGVATSFTDVLLSSLVPAHVSLVHLAGRLTHLTSLTLGDTAEAFVRTKGQAGNDNVRTHALAVHQYATGESGSSAGYVPITLPQNGAQKVEYRVTNANAQLTLVVDGYEDVV